MSESVADRQPAKRYYWLRLRDDFFTSLRIKKLRLLPRGDSYLIIYFKMQLKAIHAGGVLNYPGAEEAFCENLALDIDEAPADVQETLSFLQKCELALPLQDGGIFLPYAVANTGSESTGAERTRECRKKAKTAM